MATEEQTAFNGGGFTAAWSAFPRQGQRLTIPYREVTKLSFGVGKIAGISGDVYFRIRKVSDDSVILSKLWGDASDLPISSEWREVTFDIPATINEEVRIAVEYNGGSSGNYVKIWLSGSDVKADEVHSEYTSSWADVGTMDLLYIYTYIDGGTTSAPSVTTQAATSVDKTTATGNGNVTGLGVPAATQHGHVWATHPFPTTDDDKTEEGAPSATGAYTSSLTGLTPNTMYFDRAYVINSVGTFYGAPVAFTTDSDAPVMTTNNPTEVATTTALGNGSIDNNGGSAITQHGVVWSTSVNPDTSDSKTEEGATTTIGAFASLMVSLSAGTLYHVRAYAVNSAGTGYGADVTFTTLAAGAPIVVTRNTINVRTTTATGVGNINDIGGASVTEHGHCWGTSVNPTTGDSKTTLGAGAVGAFASAIENLTDGTTYYIRAYATNSYGTAYGNNDIIYPTSVWGATRGHLATLGEHLVYTSAATGTQRKLLGVPF